MTLSTVLVQGGAEIWTGSAFDKSTGESIYLNHNLCIKCRLQYPKNVFRCSNPSCRKPLRTRSKKKKHSMYNK